LLLLLVKPFGNIALETKGGFQIRQRWPKVRVLLRADSGFAREALMVWCEDNGVDFPTMAAIAEWEAEFNKPVVTTNQASFWAMLTMLKTGDIIPGYGRLLSEAPGG
jgi:maleate cis-trans isomerase